MLYGDPPRPRRCESAKVIQVIETKSFVGRGVESDPCRITTQYWSFEGELLAENDCEAPIIDTCKHEWEKYGDEDGGQLYRCKHCGQVTLLPSL